MLRGLPLVAVTLLTACGGGGEGKPVTTSATPSPTDTSANTVTVTVPEKPNAKAGSTGDPRFKITITGSSHTVNSGAPFQFTVRAVGAGGQPAGGTARMRVFLGTEVVDTIGFLAFTGKLTKTYRFSPLLRGKDVVLQADVEGAGGTQRANWAVQVS